MNYKIKAALRTWEIGQRYQMPQGGKMTLSFILEEERSRVGNNPTDCAMPEFLDTIHPCLYPLFVIDWRKINAKRIPTKFRGDGVMFLRAVMDEWFKECGKKNYFIDGMFTSFHSIDEVEEAIKHFTDEHLTYINEQGEHSTDYVDMEFRMGERQAEISKQRKLEDLKAQELRELEEKAQRKREEAERKAAKAAATAARQPPVTECSPGGATAPTIDQLMLEAQQLFDQSPLPKAMLQLYVRPADPAEPYTAELVWDNTGKTKKDARPSDIFTGSSFAQVITKAKTHMSSLIDELIQQQQKEHQRQAIEQQISEQNDAFSKQMEESRRMLEQMQQMIVEQQRQHEANISQLRQQIASL